MPDSQTPRQLLAAALGDDAQAEALLSGAAWGRLCDALREAERLVRGPDVPDDDRHRAEGYRYLVRFLGAGIRSCVAHDDPDYPTLQRMIDYATPWGLDHPDCLYLYAPLRGGASYTLFGNRGTANVFDVQANAGHFSAGRVEAVETLATLPSGALDVGDDGRIELHIGPDAPDRNGLRVGPEVRFLQIRQYFADWDNERPADLLIERDDATWPIPSPRPALIGRQLETLTHWIERGGALWEALGRRFLSMDDNSVFVHHVTGQGVHGALSGQYYAMGNFRCAPDEAVVLRFRTPPCRHWNVSLSNVFWECVEYASRQSSLNHHQAAPDADGSFTCVIAHTDPGHANWLDPAGNERGTLALRLHEGEGEPEIEIERLALDRLPAPSDGTRVSSSERASLLTRRRRSVLQRFRT